jgi:hypothetical protein
MMYVDAYSSIFLSCAQVGNVSSRDEITLELYTFWNVCFAILRYGTRAIPRTAPSDLWLIISSSRALARPGTCNISVVLSRLSGEGGSMSICPLDRATFYLQLFADYKFLLPFVLFVSCFLVDRKFIVQFVGVL